MRLTRWAGAVVLAACLFALPSSARAYPQFQLSTGSARCGLCHYAPAGGGLINGWGRDEAADTISSRGGDGGFLHGLWEPPDWLALGGDLRGVSGIKKTSATEPDYLLFPMQADLYALAQVGSVSVAVTAGVRGAARPRDSSLVSRLGSREHYIMWRPSSAGHYLRAGRFYAPFGLRQVDHTNYLRRELGFYAWEETYGLSYGHVKGDEWEVHATGFVRDPLLAVGPPGGGAAVLYERRILDNTAAWGAQSKVHVSDDSTRTIIGGIGKYYWDDLGLLLLGELDMGLETFAADNIDPQLQMLAHVNATYFLVQGWMLGTTIEHYQQDVRVRGLYKDAVTVSVQYFPIAHVEAQLLGKYERAGGGNQDLLGLLMLHYYL
jgi:hypothetical protein